MKTGTRSIRPFVSVAVLAAVLISMVSVSALALENLGFFAQSVGEPHTHDNITFTAWTNTTSLPSAEGSYYLTEDVTISSTWSVPAGTTNLCLNGHGIRTTSGRVINVNGGSTLNIYDCRDTAEHKFTVTDAQQNGAGLATVNDALTSGYQTFTGGYITGGNDGNGGGISVSGTLNLYGGSIIGNNASNGDGNGGGVKIENSGARFNMYGGSVQYNFGRTGGAIFVEGGVFTLEGGSVSHNRSSVRAGAIILPGVHIGKNSVIGAGSVVTRDIPENVLAVGNPCHILREIGERDCEFYSRWDDRIDWENLDAICEIKKGLPKFN